MEVVVTPNAGDRNDPGAGLEAASDKNNIRCTPRRTLSEYLGAYEFLSAEPEMWRATITEMVATASLLFTLTTTIIASLESHGPDPKFVVPIVVFVSAFLHLLVTIPLSGGHMNPIFTFLAALKGAITWVRALSYFSAQFLGSLICCLVLMGSMDHTLIVKYSLGGCSVGANGPGAAFLMEVSCTFLVLYVGVTVAFDRARTKELGLPAVCGMVAGVYAVAVFISISITGRVGYGGVGLNPVRCLGPALVFGGPLWNMHWIFWIGPLCACLLYHVFSLTLPS